MATRSKPRARPADLTRAASAAGVIVSFAPGQDHQPALGQRPAAVRQEPLPAGPPVARLPLRPQVRRRGTRLLGRVEAGDGTLHLQLLHPEARLPDDIARPLLVV